MDFTIWRNIASLWVQIRDPEDIKLTADAIQTVFNDTLSRRHTEKTLYEELMDGIDDEEDDDGY